MRKKSIASAIEALKTAHGKLLAAREHLEPIQAADERGRAGALIEQAMDILKGQISRRSASKCGPRTMTSPQDRSPVGVTGDAAKSLEAT